MTVLILERDPLYIKNPLKTTEIKLSIIITHFFDMHPRKSAIFARSPMAPYSKISYSKKSYALTSTPIPTSNFWPSFLLLHPLSHN